MEIISTTSIKKNSRRISFPYKGGIYRFSLDQIIRLEAESNYTYIHLENQRPILMAKVLSEYEKILEHYGFIRTHRSHLVNWQHIADVRMNEVVMDDQSTADISRRKRKEVLNALNHYSNAA